MMNSSQKNYYIVDILVIIEKILVVQWYEKIIKKIVKQITLPIIFFK